MMETVMNEIFGTYTPYIFPLDNGEFIACADFGYIARVAIFGIFLVSLFKLVGVLFKR